MNFYLGTLNFMVLCLDGLFSASGNKSLLLRLAEIYLLLITKWTILSIQVVKTARLLQSNYFNANLLSDQINILIVFENFIKLQQIGMVQNFQDGYFRSKLRVTKLLLNHLYCSCIIRFLFLPSCVHFPIGSTPNFLN